MTEEQIRQNAKLIYGQASNAEDKIDAYIAGAHSRDGEINQLKKALSSAQKAMAELAQMARNPWISVKDKLPEDDVEVIGMEQGGWVFLIWRNSNEWCGEEYRELLCPEITYWMPIPKL